jgi:hypothetical protein
MVLLYVLFAKVVPIISIWELKAGDHPPARCHRRLTGGNRSGAAPVKAVYALYRRRRRGAAGGQPAAGRGSADRDITMLSSRPMEEFEFGQMDRDSSIWWIACGGGLSGMLLALLLAWFTQTAWPINVGGLPTFAWWPFLIIIFELTMLGAILATAAALVVTAGLGRQRGLYDPAVSDGRILVGVEDPADEVVPAVEEALGAVPGAELRRL